MEIIKVRNNLRRPVMFRVPGKSIRLSPGQSTEIPGHCLEARELKKLCSRKSVSILREKKEEQVPTGPETGEKEEEKKEKKTEDTVKGKAKKPGKTPGKPVKSREKKAGAARGDEKP